ncbi:MAG: hypothetical protein U1E55_03010 [Paracoccus sp. (in: a-proteobacteria)]
MIRGIPATDCCQSRRGTFDAHSPDAFFDRSDGLPLQVQPRRQIIAAVSAGRLRAGEKSVFDPDLGRASVVARVTVAQAFAELVSTDYLDSRDRSAISFPTRSSGGSRPSHPPRARTLDWDSQLDHRFSRAQRSERNRNWRSYGYPFVYGQADPALVDHAAWRDCAMRTLGRRGFVAVTGDLYDADDPESGRSHRPADPAPARHRGGRR